MSEAATALKDFETACFLCGSALVEGECPAYHWHDAKHIENRELIEKGLAPIPNEHVPLPEKADWGPCWVCGAPTDPEGRCTCINAFCHSDLASDYGYQDAPWNPAYVADYAPWVKRFHTREEAENAPPVTFLIEGFLQREGVTAIAGPVRERKSLIALNMVHALLTGEKLFGHFEVTRRPSHVLYLCPEVSLGPFTDRVRKIGLMDYVGRGLFYRTMSSDPMKLTDDDLADALPGSVVFLDTAIRFLEGDENSSADIRAFADFVFALLKNGAESVVLLHHSPKDLGDTMTLENAMRGSGDMGAFLACCWGTRLQDPADPYKSASFLSNLKQRDFESKDFEVTCGADCRMHMVEAGLTVPVLTRRKGFKANRDGMDGAAEAILQANPSMSLRETMTELEKRGIKRGRDWISRARFRLERGLSEEA